MEMLQDRAAGSRALAFWTAAEKSSRGSAASLQPKILPSWFHEAIMVIHSTQNMSIKRFKCVQALVSD